MIVFEIYPKQKYDVWNTVCVGGKKMRSNGLYRRVIFGCLTKEVWNKKWMMGDSCLWDNRKWQYKTKKTKKILNEFIFNTLEKRIKSYKIVKFMIINI